MTENDLKTLLYFTCVTNIYYFENHGDKYKHLGVHKWFIQSLLTECGTVVMTERKYLGIFECLFQALVIEQKCKL